MPYYQFIICSQVFLNQEVFLIPRRFLRGLFSKKCGQSAFELINPFTFSLSHDVKFKIILAWSLFPFRSVITHLYLSATQILRILSSNRTAAWKLNSGENQWSFIPAAQCLWKSPGNHHIINFVYIGWVCSEPNDMLNDPLNFKDSN